MRLPLAIALLALGCTLDGMARPFLALSTKEADECWAYTDQTDVGWHQCRDLEWIGAVGRCAWYLKAD